MSLFLHLNIWINVALHHLFTNGSSSVNVCAIMNYGLIMSPEATVLNDVIASECFVFYYEHKVFNFTRN